MKHARNGICTALIAIGTAFVVSGAGGPSAARHGAASTADNDWPTVVLANDWPTGVSRPANDWPTGVSGPADHRPTGVSAPGNDWPTR
ncbi:hypothetical protein ABH935_008349 [Catenulispora sp. GAS73]|uniref:hypothetical protein n=1 Tax=Catenulispora sp. GAS73 TaxID=3156269 RepID=UPI003516D8C2